MDKIINNPGLQHITEDILLNLDFKKLQVCVFVNKNFEEILQNPIFWLKKWRLKGLSKENHAEWVKAIQLSKNKNLETNILAYIKKIIEIGHFVDVPCFIDKKVVENVPNNIAYYDFKFAQVFYHWPKSNIDYKIGILQLLAPLTEDPNTIKIKKCPQIHVAIENENVEIVRILAPISKTPNSKDQHGQTAISRAAKQGKLEIIEILTPLVNDPNEKDDNGQTPTYHAAKFGHTKIVKFLAPLIKNLNGFEKFRWSPSSRVARVYGHYEIADFLQSYCQLNNLYL